jgi:hypothetical protein
MSGVMLETEICEFASRDCCEMHDLRLFFIIWSCENAVSQRHVDGKGICIYTNHYKLLYYKLLKITYK